MRITSTQLNSVECDSSASWWSSFRSLGERGSPCRLVFHSDECENGSCVALLKGISEKRTRILQRHIAESERQRIAMTDLSGYRRYTLRARVEMKSDRDSQGVLLMQRS